MSSKTRLTVTVDPEFVAAASQAVEMGRASSLSAWVNEALADRVDRDRRLQALGDAIAAYEAEHGVITLDDVARQQRKDRSAARVIRDTPRQRRSKTTGAA